MAEEKLKLWVYPQAQAACQPQYGYHNTLPFDGDGWKQVELVPLRHAEYLWCGQIREFAANPFPVEHFEYFKDAPDRHMVDLEGDYLPGKFREEFAGSVRIACGAPHSWRGQKVFPRPAASQLLVNLARQNMPTDLRVKCKRMVFVGKPDHDGVREKMAQALNLAQTDNFLRLLQEWNGPAPVGSSAHELFTLTMGYGGIALCPQGEGVATSRFYEVCAFGRMPVVIGETMLLGEDRFDMSFVTQIPDCDIETMSKRLAAVAATPIEEVIARGAAARNYFDAIVRPYYHDPTRFFLDWLRKA